MIEEQAVVVGVEQDQALLEIIRSKPCGLCGQTRGCGVSLWGRLFGHRTHVFKAHNAIEARVGDSVVVGVDEQALLAGSMLTYGVPLLGMLAGAALAASFSGVQSDAATVAGAVAGLLLGLLWTRGHAAGSAASGRYRPVILRAALQPVTRCQRGD